MIYQTRLKCLADQLETTDLPTSTVVNELMAIAGLALREGSQGGGEIPDRVRGACELLELASRETVAPFEVH